MTDKPTDAAPVVVVPVSCPGHPSLEAIPVTSWVLLGYIVRSWGDNTDDWLPVTLMGLCRACPILKIKTKQNMSRHLTRLVDAGLVLRRREADRTISLKPTDRAKVYTLAYTPKGGVYTLACTPKGGPGVVANIHTPPEKPIKPGARGGYTRQHVHPTYIVNNKSIYKKKKNGARSAGYTRQHVHPELDLPAAELLDKLTGELYDRIAGIIEKPQTTPRAIRISVKRLLSKKDPDEIRKVIAWAFGPNQERTQYRYMIESGRAFAEKYDSMILAMAREKPARKKGRKWEFQH